MADHNAELAVTGSVDTLSSVGVVDVEGIVLKTNRPDTLASTGTVDVKASLAETEDRDTLNSLGKSLQIVEVAILNANDSLVIEAASLTEGTLAVTGRDDTSDNPDIGNAAPIAGTLDTTTVGDTLVSLAALEAKGAFAATNAGDVLTSNVYLTSQQCCDIDTLIGIIPSLQCAIDSQNAFTDFWDVVLLNDPGSPYVPSPNV